MEALEAAESRRFRFPPVAAASIVRECAGCCAKTCGTIEYTACSIGSARNNPWLR